MKSTIQIIFLAFILLCFGCKKKDIYHIKYSKDIYLPQFFKAGCGKLFDRPEIAISLDTFNMHSYMSPAHPIYAYCNDDVHIQQFFGTNESKRSPFYIGNVHTTANINMELFTLSGFLGTYNRWVTGYFALKQPGGFAIFKGYESNTDQSASLQPFVYKNYLLLWEETMPVDTGVDPTKRKDIAVQYCILKLMNNGTMAIVPQQEAAQLLKEDVFPGVPSLG